MVEEVRVRASTTVIYAAVRTKSKRNAATKIASKAPAKDKGQAKADHPMPVAFKQQYRGGIVGMEVGRAAEGKRWSGGR